MKAIMYHYIRDYDKGYPFFNFLSKEKFKKQLNLFEKNILSKYENFSKNDDQIILTFDDGLKDHIFVAEELKKETRQVSFFIPTYQFESNEFLDVHKAHLLSGKVSSEVILKKLEQYLKKGIRNFINSDEKIKFKDKYSKNNDGDKKEFKKIVNYCGNIELRSEILDYLLSEFDINSDPKKFYLNSDEIKYISDLGMIIGSHSVNHNLLSRLNKKRTNNRIKKFKESVRKYNKKRVQYFLFSLWRKRLF